MHYSFKVYKNGKPVYMCSTHKIRRFLIKSRLINFEEQYIKVYLKVTYGRFLNNRGKMVNFHNDGIYDNRTDYWFALNAFIEGD
jgi:hypothetical protein